MVPAAPGKFFNFPSSSRPWNVLEINVGSGKFWKFDVRVLECF